MKHLLPLILALSACTAPRPAEKPQRGTVPDGWEDKAPQTPPTHLDSMRNMHQQYRHNASQIKNYPF